MRKQLRDILKHMEVPELRGVFLLGCFERRVTLYSQQVRALNLVHALFEAGRLKPGSRLVVVGAGAGGLTVAAGAALRGCDVSVLEQRQTLLPLLSQNRTRWLHPHIYDWPAPGSEVASAGLPVLDWTAGRVHEVVEQLQKSWEALQRRQDIKLELRQGVAGITPVIASNGDLARVSWNDSEGYTPPRAVDALVLAVGFGTERQEPERGFLSYWENDNLDQSVGLPIQQQTRILVSGTGDGGLVDLLRAMLRDFDPGRLLQELLAPTVPAALKDELLSIEDEVQNGRVRADALSERYRALKIPQALDSGLKAQLRPGIQAVLNGTAADPLGTGASIMNRFLVSRLFSLGLQYRAGELEAPVRVNGEYEVAFGSERPMRFHRVILRHGPQSTLKQDFPWLPSESLAKMRARSELDQTRERLWPDGAFGGGGTEAAPRVNPRPPSAPASLPQRDTSAFVGNHHLLEQVVSAVLEEAPVPRVVHGFGGVGKTRLAIEALHDLRVAERYASARYFVRAEAMTSEESIFGLIARALGIEAGADLEARVYSALEERPAVLVLDGLDAVKGYSPLILRLLARLERIEGLALVLTGRTLPPPGTWGRSRVLVVPPLEPSAARELFRCLVPAVDLMDPRVDELLRDYNIPLAIHILAPNMKGIPPDVLLERLRHWRRFTPEPGFSTVASRARPLSATLLDTLLSPGALRVAAILAHLPNGAVTEDLRQVFPDLSAEVVAELKKLGLIQTDELGRERVHALYHDWKDSILAPRARPEDLARAVHFYGGLAERLGPKVGGREGAAASERLRPEVENLEAMLLLGLKGTNVPGVIDQALALNNFWRFSGYGSPHILSQVREAARQRGDGLREALCFQVEGQVALERSRHAEAEAYFRQALELFSTVDPQHTDPCATLGYARSLRGVASMALDGGRIDEAEQCFRGALLCFRRVGSRVSEGNCIHGLGKVALDRGSLDEARARFEEALSLFMELEDRLGRAHCLRSLGELEGSTEKLEQAHALFAEVGNPRGKAHCLRALGGLALNRSDFDSAHALYEQARTLLKQVGSLRGQANCIMGLGQLAARRGQPEVARVHFQDASALFAQVNDAARFSLCQTQLGALGDSPRQVTSRLQPSMGEREC